MRSKWEEEWCCKMEEEERTHSRLVEELERFMVTEAGESASTCDELSVGDQQEDGEMKLGSGQDGEAESEDVEVDGQTGEEEIPRELEVYLCPVERSGGHVWISLEEMQRYSRFCRCCYWLCGTCLIISPSQ